MLLKLLARIIFCGGALVNYLAGAFLEQGTPLHFIGNEFLTNTLYLAAWIWILLSSVKPRKHPCLYYGNLQA